MTGPLDRRTVVPAAVLFVPAVMLLLALAPWPYGYFVFLRLVVCAASVWIAFAVLGRNTNSKIGWAFVAIAILYNPIIRVPLEREIWMVVNVVTAVPFFYLGLSRKTQ